MAVRLLSHHEDGARPEVKALFTPTSEVMERLGRIIVINDSAHSIGSCLHGMPSGAQTDVAIFSLHAVKNLRRPRVELSAEYAHAFRQ